MVFRCVPVHSPTRLQGPGSMVTQASRHPQRKANTMYSSAALSKARRLALFEKRYGAMTFCNAGFRQWIVLELGVDNVHANALINLGNG